MTELKTLKDIQIPDSFYSKSKIKKEAIKWVKEANKNNLSVDWLTFFNITSEDLK